MGLNLKGFKNSLFKHSRDFGQGMEKIKTSYDEDNFTDADGNVKFGSILKSVTQTEVSIATATYSDITGASITFSLSSAKNILVLGTSYFGYTADVTNALAGIQISIDGTAKTNSERILRLNLKDSVTLAAVSTSNTEASLSTSYAESLEKGSHTIKMQGRSDGTNDVTFFGGKTSLVVIILG